MRLNEEYKILLCSWCDRAYDRETRQYVAKPNKVLSHGVCDECYNKTMANLKKYRETPPSPPA
jgi:hypothetical protein